MAESKENLNFSSGDTKETTKLPVGFDSKLSFRPKSPFQDLFYILDENDPHKINAKYSDTSENCSEHASNERNILDSLIDNKEIKIEGDKIFIGNDLLVTVSTNKDGDIDHGSYITSPVNALSPIDPKLFLKKYVCPGIEVYIEGKGWIPYNQESESIIIFNSQTRWRINKELLEKYKNDGIIKVITEDDNNKSED